MATECSCGSPPLGYDPECPLHGTTVRSQADFFIDGRPYEGEPLFPDLRAAGGGDT